MGSVPGGGTFRVSASPGPHRFRVRFRLSVWSDPLDVTIDPEEELQLVCGTDWRGYPWVRIAPGRKVIRP